MHIYSLNETNYVQFNTKSLSQANVSLCSEIASSGSLRAGQRRLRTETPEKNGVNSIKGNYWELVPEVISEIDGKIIYSYSAKVLGTRQNDGIEYLLHITSQDGMRFTQTWCKVASGFEPFSLGDSVILNINPLQPQEGNVINSKTPSQSVLVTTSLPATQGKDWLIPPEIKPITDSLLTLDGTEYKIYDGEIVRILYETIYDIAEGYDRDSTYIKYSLDIDFAIKGGGVKHYVDHRKARGGVPTTIHPERLSDQVLVMVRNWKAEESIKVLVNQYYPGFWWIVNESRSEAVYVAQGVAQMVDYDLWRRLTN